LHSNRQAVVTSQYRRILIRSNAGIDAGLHAPPEVFAAAGPDVVHDVVPDPLSAFACNPQPDACGDASGDVGRAPGIDCGLDPIPTAGRETLIEVGPATGLEARLDPLPDGNNSIVVDVPYAAAATRAEAFPEPDPHATPYAGPHAMFPPAP